MELVNIQTLSQEMVLDFLYFFLLNILVFLLSCIVSKYWMHFPLIMTGELIQINFDALEIFLPWVPSKQLEIFHQQENPWTY